MEDDNNLDGISRRGILQGGLSAGIGIVGLSGTTLAERDVEPGDIVRLRQSPKVRSILSELDLHGTITRERVEKRVNEDLGLESLQVEYEFGSLYFGEVADESTATFLFDDEYLAHGSRARIPAAYRDVPSGTAGRIVGTEDGTEFYRLATDREHDLILANTSIDGEDPIIYTGSGIDGFYVDVTSHPRKQIVEQRLMDAEIRRYRVEPVTAEAITTSPLAELSEPIGTDTAFSQTLVSVTSIEDEIRDLIGDVEQAASDCGLGCVQCVGDIILDIAVSCRICIPVCSTSPTFVGAILCIGCVWQFCSLLGTAASCILCLDCLQDNGHL